MNDKTFITAINCIDGRVQMPVIEFVLKEFKADYVDLVTEPGPDLILSENVDLNVIESIKKRVLVSVEKHGSKVVIIIGHHDCAVNPVEKEEHLEQIAEAVKNIKEWGLEVEVYGVCVDCDWVAESI